MSYRVYPYSLSGGKSIDWLPGVPLAAWGGPGRTQGAVRAAPKTRNYTRTRVKGTKRAFRPRSSHRPAHQQVRSFHRPLSTCSPHEGRPDCHPPHPHVCPAVPQNHGPAARLPVRCTCPLCCWHCPRGGWRVGFHHWHCASDREGEGVRRRHDIHNSISIFMQYRFHLSFFLCSYALLQINAS
jgi:hypothetical protein